ncbi:MAG: AEC family transporter [Clostridia bacterium]|nr:AEC family transporter [Clostridia bacterium]
MLDSIIYSINNIMPMFIIVIFGAILGRTGFLGEGFLSVCDKLVFKIALPCMLFVEIASAKSVEFNPRLVGFCIAAVFICLIISIVIVPIFLKDNAKRGAFIQGIYRSNAAIIGLTMAENMFPENGAAVMSTIMSFTVALYNVFAILVLSIYAPSDVKLKPKQLALRVCKTIVANPLIIAIVLALLWKLIGVSLPTVAEKSLNYLANMAMPLALISLGASFKAESLRGRFRLALISSALKTIVVPAATVLCAIPLGFRGVELGSIFILFGGPVAVSSYIMAKQMKSDHELAAQILLISTLMSVFTLLAGTLILKQTGLI